MAPIVARRGVSRIQNAKDVNFPLDVGNDGKVMGYDHASGLFVPVTGGGGTPGGSTTQVQYNSSGSFAGHSGFVYDGSGTATLSTALVTPVIRPASDSISSIQIKDAADSDCILSINSTSNRVGINTNYALYDLDIRGTQCVISGTGFPAFKAIYTGGATIKMQALSSSAIFGTETNHNCDFRVNNVTVARFSTDGHTRIYNSLSVGTSTPPNAELDVVGTARVDALRIDQTPTAETPAATHTAVINLNGTDYRMLLAPAA